MALPSEKIRTNSTIFVDTSGLVAILVDSDSLHQRAKLLMLQLREDTVSAVTTEMVFVELANGLSAPKFRQTAIGLIDELRSMKNLEVVWSGPELFEKATELYRNRPDKEWSLTDCASFVVMRERNISLAFTSDKHFEQAGFVRLLEN